MLSTTIPTEKNYTISFLHNNFIILHHTPTEVHNIHVHALNYLFMFVIIIVLA